VREGGGERERERAGIWNSQDRRGRFRKIL
jgi:hypothetical protein